MLHVILGKADCIIIESLEELMNVKFNPIGVREINWVQRILLRYGFRDLNKEL